MHVKNKNVSAKANELKNTVFESKQLVTGATENLLDNNSISRQFIL